MTNTKFYLYARKSTEDDDHQIMSIEAQLCELREFARKDGLSVIEEITESKSAKIPGREKFGEMMAKIEKADGVGILAWHPDRLNAPPSTAKEVCWPCVVGSRSMVVGSIFAPP